MITDRFVFVHLPRTGGSTLKSYVREHLVRPGLVRWLGNLDHQPASAAAFLELFTFGLVRNPWDWYVSRWHARNFVDFPGNAPGLTFAEHLERGFLVPGFSLTNQVRRMFCDAEGQDLVSFLGKTEELDEVFRLVCSAAGLEGISLPPVSTQPRIRATEHGPYRDYYPPKLRDLVREMDWRIVKEFGYRFE